MKNIYQENDRPEQGENISSGSFDFEDVKFPESESPGNTPNGQGQSPLQEPGVPPYQPNGQVYYVQPQPGYAVQGVPMPPFQLTQEQIAILLQQYVIPQQQGQFQPQPQQYQQPQPTVQDGADAGMRVLYQSPDFDKSVNSPDDIDRSYTEGTAGENKPPVAEESITIEEESISMPSVRKASPTLNGRFSIEEVEMSAFELDSMMSRKQGRSRSYDEYYSRSSFTGDDVSSDASSSRSVNFDVEEMIDEEVTDISSNVKEKKKISKGEIVRRCVLGISLVAIIVSLAMLFNEYRLSKENDNFEDEISDLIVDVPVTDEKEEKEPTEKEEEDKSTTAAPTPEQQWAQIKKEFPRVNFPQNLQLKYARLYATNQDFVGYLEAKGIDLGLPIVQTDNDSDYMEKNFYGNKTKYGCPFVTHLNNIGELDQNTVIFGHHMNNGTVFGALDEYKTIDGFKKAPVITFNTLYKDYSWKVIAAFVTNAYEKDDNDYIFRYYFTSLSTQDRFAAYLNELSQRSLYDTGVDVLPTDKLLTLSTCSHEFTDARFVVVARLVRNGESTDVDVTRATVNPNPRYPQAYYDKKKIKNNPYANASRWEVG